MVAGGALAGGVVDRADVLFVLPVDAGLRVAGGLVGRGGVVPGGDGVARDGRARDGGVLGAGGDGGGRAGRTGILVQAVAAGGGMGHSAARRGGDGGGDAAGGGAAGDAEGRRVDPLDGAAVPDVDRLDDGSGRDPVAGHPVAGRGALLLRGGVAGAVGRVRAVALVAAALVGCCWLVYALVQNKFEKEVAEAADADAAGVDRQAEFRGDRDGRAYVERTLWQSIYMPRYMGFVWIAFWAVLVSLLMRLPTRGFRYAAVGLLVAVNLAQFSARLFAGTEPPLQRVAAEIWRMIRTIRRRT